MFRQTMFRQTVSRRPVRRRDDRCFINIFSIKVFSRTSDAQSGATGCPHSGRRRKWLRAQIVEIFVSWLTGRQDEVGAAQGIQSILRSYGDKYNDDVSGFRNAADAVH